MFFLLCELSVHRAYFKVFPGQGRYWKENKSLKFGIITLKIQPRSRMGQEIYNISKFQIHTTALLTYHYVDKIRSPEFINLIVKICITLINFFPLSSLLDSGNHKSSLCFYEFLLFLESTYKQDHTIFVFSVWPISIRIMPLRFAHIVTNGQTFFFFMAEKYSIVYIRYIWFVYDNIYVHVDIDIPYTAHFLFIHPSIDT